MTSSGHPIGEPWGLRLWLALFAVATVALALQTYGISTWPMADDEVLSLVQMSLFQLDAKMFSFPPDHIEKLPRAVPVWNAVQSQALALLPGTVVGFRIPSVICGVLTSALAFMVAARWKGLWFAFALAILVNASQLFVHVSQVNRFYSMPLLLLTLTLTSMWLPYGRLMVVGLTAFLAVLTVLSHNATVPIFGLAFAASAAIHVLRLAPVWLVVRSGAAFAATASVYLWYLRPLVSGWHTTGNPTPVLVSFAAHAGIPTVALGLLGCWLAVTRDRGTPALWWALLFAGSLCLFQLSSFSWNPRYFVFFLPVLWVLAASATHHVAQKLDYGSMGVVWYACVLMLLLPNLVSHLADGSRHDYRRAAAIVTEHVHSDEVILSDDAETISYYLAGELRERLFVRTKVTTPPEPSFLLVTRSNAWMPQPHYAGRQVELLAEISRRRLDQFSHIVRVYRVHASVSRQDSP